MGDASSSERSDMLDVISSTARRVASSPLTYARMTCWITLILSAYKAQRIVPSSNSDCRLKHLVYTHVSIACVETVSPGNGRGSAVSNPRKDLAPVGVVETGRLGLKGSVELAATELKGNDRGCAFNDSSIETGSDKGCGTSSEG